MQKRVLIAGMMFGLTMGSHGQEAGEGEEEHVHGEGCGCAAEFEAEMRAAIPVKPAAPMHELKAVEIGEGEYRFRTALEWTKLPEGVKLGSTHGGVISNEAGQIFVSTDGGNGISIFSGEEGYVRGVAPGVRGLHSLAAATFEGEGVLLCAHLAAGRVVMMDFSGKECFALPVEGGDFEVPGGWKGVTAAVQAPDGSIFVAMGYGSNRIHKFDSQGKLLKSFGGEGEGEGEFRCCHGLAIDKRFGEPRLLVADQNNGRLVHLSLEGEFLSVFAEGLRRPSAVAFEGDRVAVAELEGRVSILNKEGGLILTLGDNPKVEQRARYGVPVRDWKPGVFTAPHGLCFDRAGNLYVQDWNRNGRVRKLERIK